MTMAALRENRAAIMEIAARNGAQNLRIFGSVARGDAKGSSDVDILVEMEPGRSLLDLSGLVLDLETSSGGMWTSLPKRPCIPASNSGCWLTPP